MFRQIQFVHVFIQENGFQINRIIYSAGISACALGTRWQRSLALLSQLTEGGQPDVVSYNAVSRLTTGRPSCVFFFGSNMPLFGGAQHQSIFGKLWSGGQHCIICYLLY